MMSRFSFCCSATALLLAVLSATPSWAQSTAAQPVNTHRGTPSTGPHPVANAANTANEDDEPGELLLLDVTVERSMVGASMSAYIIGNAVFVPLGELARVLTLALTVDPQLRRASGYILNPNRSFQLDLAKNQVSMSGRVEAINPEDFRVLSDDIYVDTTLLENWWPMRLQPDRRRQVLEVQPREALPLQLRIAREQAAQVIGRASPETEPLPDVATPYAWVSWPAIDQTLGLTLSQSRSVRAGSLTSASYVTGDLLGLEASAFVSLSASMIASEVRALTRQASLRMTLGRSDPGGRAISFLPSTAFALGNVLMPGVNNLFRSSTAGIGFAMSNFPLARGTNFSTTSFTGALPPGWDVQLFFNEALIGYQQSRADGSYNFTDVPLIFGENQFRLVFNGPQGQTRVETRHYNLESSVGKPGELLYTAGLHRSATGQPQGQAQWEYGFNPNLSVYGGVALASPQATMDGRLFANGGLRLFFDGWILTSDLARCMRCERQGQAWSMGFSRRLERGTLSATHTRLEAFASESHPALGTPLRSRSKLRLDTTLGPQGAGAIPFVTQWQVDSRQTGLPDLYLNTRASHAWQGAAFTHELVWQSLAGQKTMFGSVQASRPTRTTSLRGQLNYRTLPGPRLDSGILSADRKLETGQLLNLQVAHSFAQRDTSLALLMNHNFNAFSVRMGVSVSSAGVTTAGIQIFTSLARDSGAQRWNFSALPSAAAGAASARVFLDRNLNGMFDTGDEPVSGAAFFVNGAGSSVRTNEAGYAYLPRLPAFRSQGITLNTASLDDSNWSSGPHGVRILPRPGRVASVQFPVVIAAEVDGYVQLDVDGDRRGVADVQLELWASDGSIAARVRSTADGYFLFSGIKPGRYRLSVAEDQIKRLRLEPVEALAVTVTADGDAGPAQELVLRRSSNAANPWKTRIPG